VTTAIHAIESSGLGRMMRESLWAYPIVETLHIVGLAIVYGSIVVVDLRLLGLSRGVSASRLAHHALPWTIGAFFLVMTTGLMMFTAHTEDFLGNRIFMLKMGLILTGAVNAAMLHAGAFRTVSTWDTGAVPPPGVRAAAAVSIIVWTGVIACGRFLAYT
jgi:hypothetical protein